MNAVTVHSLSIYTPDPPGMEYMDDPPEDPADYAQEDPDICRFVLTYRNLRFGYDLARALAIKRIKEFPTFLYGDDLWVFNAFKHFWGHRRTPDYTIKTAASFMSPAMDFQRGVLNALLVSKLDYQGEDTAQEIMDNRIEYISERLGFDFEVIKCYEKLFFNVLDRQLDLAFTAEQIYPHTRLVEKFNNYANNEALHKLLLRTGYNNGPEEVLYAAGYRSAFLQNIATDAPAKFEQMVMANGYFLCKNGWLNQGPTSSPGMGAARQLLQAAKMGGQTGEAQTPFKSAGEILMQEIKRRAATPLQLVESTDIEVLS